MDNTDSLKPALLDQHFSRQTKYKKLTADEVKQKVSGDEWKQEWEHPQILDELLLNPIPVTTAEALCYKFDLKDPTTCSLLKQSIG